MKKASTNQIELLYLPECVIRKIFGYLNGEDIFLSLRKTCKLFSKYVDNYIQVDGVFLLVTGATKQGHAQGNNSEDAWCFEDRPPCKMVYILKHNQKVLSIIGETIPSLPNPTPQALLFFSETNFKLQSCNEIACFGGLVKGVIIAGYLCKECWDETESGSISRNMPSSRYMIRHHIYKLVPYLYEYDRSRELWIPITTLHSTLEPLIFSHDIDCTLDHCSEEESILLKLDIHCNQMSVCSKPGICNNHHNHRINRDALVLFKFKTLTKQNGSSEIKNSSSLRYKMKFFRTTDKLNKTQDSQGSVYTFSKASGSVMYLRDGGTPSKNDKTLEKLNYTIERTPMSMDMSGQYSIRLYRSKGLMLQNRLYFIGAYLPTPKKAGGFSLGCNDDGLVCYKNNNIRSFAFSIESLYSNSKFHIYKAVTDVEESFSIILSRIDYPSIWDSELLLIVLTDNLDSKNHLNGQEIDKNCVYHPGVYFDRTDVRNHISQASNSTILRID